MINEISLYIMLENIIQFKSIPDIQFLHTSVNKLLILALPLRYYKNKQTRWTDKNEPKQEMANLPLPIYQQNKKNILVCNIVIATEQVIYVWLPVQRFGLQRKQLVCICTTQCKIFISPFSQCACYFKREWAKQPATTVTLTR